MTNAEILHEIDKKWKKIEHDIETEDTQSDGQVDVLRALKRINNNYY